MLDISQQIARLVNTMPLLEAPLLALLQDLSSACAAKTRGPAAFAAAETSLCEHLTTLSIAAEVQLLAAQQPDAQIITYQEQRWKRLDPTNCEALTPYGRGSLSRSRYRLMGVHNGPTIDPVEINAGLLGAMTPGAARLTGALQAVTTSREASRLMETMHIKLSRSAIERGSALVAEQLEADSDVMEDALIQNFELPREAVAVALSVDRVNLPYEVPLKRPAGRPRNGAPKRPCEVVCGQVYCGCWTLFDNQGEPLYTCRYGREPGDQGRVIIEDQLREDLLALRRKKPDLKVVTLSDGAAEMLQMLDRVVEGIPVSICLVDFWHAYEYVLKALVALGKDTEEEKKRIKRSMLTAHSGPRKALMKIRSWASELEGDVPEDVSRAIKYLSNRLKEGKMGYAAAREAKLPVGSGHVEATCKTVVATRMKRAGSRWKKISAQHVLTLRSLFVSSRYEQAHAWLVDWHQEHHAPIRCVA